jgi:hypothetical protein
MATKRALRSKHSSIAIASTVDRSDIAGEERVMGEAASQAARHVNCSLTGYRAQGGRQMLGSNA